MTGTAIYAPENRELDLGRLNPLDYDLISSLKGIIHQGDAILLCKNTSGDREMYVRKVRGHYYAAHFKGGGHGEHAIRRMTTEHLHGTDCWLTAWTRAGIETGREVATTNRVRLDAVAFGTRITALEVQVEPQSTSRVKGRHTQRRQAKAFTGDYAQVLDRPLEVVWFAPIGEPEWLYQVPSIQCRNRSWEVAPDPAVVPAIGVQSIDIKLCSPTWFPRCPTKKRSWCDGRHPWTEPRGGLSIAEVAEQIPRGQLVTVKIPDRGVYYTDLVGRARWEDFSSGVTYQEPANRPRTDPPLNRPCGWQGHQDETSALDAPAAELAATVVLDWRRGRIGPLAPCALCGQATLCRSPLNDEPCHKGCAEKQIARAARDASHLVQLIHTYTAR